MQGLWEESGTQQFKENLQNINKLLQNHVQRAEAWLKKLSNPRTGLTKSKTKIKTFGPFGQAALQAGIGPSKI